MRRLQRIERLVEIEKDGRTFSHLQQSAGLVRRVRGLLREESDLMRRRARLERRQAA